MYEFNLTLNLPFAAAMDAVREALLAEKLGIVSEVDVQGVFKNKMDKDIPPYRILGACNPVLADRLITEEPNAGVLLPCNLVLRAEGDDSTVVSFLEPSAVLGLTDAAAAQSVAADAKAMLERVVARLSAI